MNTAQTKQPAFYREPVLPEIVIPALKNMEGTGRYDKNVLLWLQDGYVNRAIKENVSQLMALHTSLVEAGESPEAMKREKTRALIGFATDIFNREMGEGREADLKSYGEAAKTFFEAETARYGGHLQDLVEYIKKALENGEKPDIDSHSRWAYVSYRKLWEASERLEGLSGKIGQLTVVNAMKKSVERLNFITVADQPTNVGKHLWEAVERISKNPSKYIAYSDPDRIEMPKREPWDYEPMQRQGEYTHRF